MPKYITKTLHKNYDFKTYFHNFIGENVEKWAKLGVYTLGTINFHKNHILTKVPWLDSNQNDLSQKNSILGIFDINYANLCENQIFPAHAVFCKCS